MRPLWLLVSDFPSVTADTPLVRKRAHWGLGSWVLRGSKAAPWYLTFRPFSEWAPTVHLVAYALALTYSSFFTTTLQRSISISILWQKKQKEGWGCVCIQSQVCVGLYLKFFVLRHLVFLVKNKWQGIEQFTASYFHKAEAWKLSRWRLYVFHGNWDALHWTGELWIYSGCKIRLWSKIWILTCFALVSSSLK